MSKSDKNRNGRRASTPDPVARVGSGSLTERATKALLDAIMAGRFKSGRLPPEPELGSMLAVSRTTVRTALQQLEQLGLISRTPGRGTIIRSQVGRESVALQRLVGFRALLEERGYRVDLEHHVTLSRTPDPHTVAALSLEVDTPVLRGERFFGADGVPAITIWYEVPLDYVDPATRERLLAGRPVEAPESIFEFSKKFPGREIEYAAVEIEPSVATETEPAGLALQAGEPFQVLNETLYTGTSEPVGYGRVHVNDRFLRFKIIRHVKGGL